jgi:RNA polymerase sigma factor for flagellar operon FliA
MVQSARTRSPLIDGITAKMMPAVRRIAFQVARRLPRHVNVDELIGAGCLGLACACANFDPARAEGFTAYAETRIRGAMLDELRSIDPLSRDQRTFAKRLASAKRTLAQRFGREPTSAEIADHLELPLGDYWSRAADTDHTVVLALDDERGDLYEVRDGGAVAPDERLADVQARRAAREAVEALPPRLRLVVDLHYGEGRTLREIGARLGVTESRACQLLSQATREMRARCAPEETQPRKAPRSVRRPELLAA